MPIVDRMVDLISLTSDRKSPEFRESNGHVNFHLIVRPAWHAFLSDKHQPSKSGESDEAERKTSMITTSGGSLMTKDVPKTAAIQLPAGLSPVQR